MINRDDILNNLGDTSAGGVLYEDDSHKLVWLGMEAREEENVVHVNQYLIIHNDKGYLLDAGGISVFPQVVSNLSRYMSIENLEMLFYSHQDPDVSSGVALWMDVCKANAYIGSYWTQFVPHFGVKDLSRVKPIDDGGMRYDLGNGDYLDFIPAHYLHSVSNFHLYDSRSKILFSGDMGAALFPVDGRYIFIEDFNKHVELMELFHKRFMASNSALRDWVDRVKKYDISLIVPQHGAIFDGENINRFLDWLYSLKCGVDNL